MIPTPSESDLAAAVKLLDQTLSGIRLDAHERAAWDTVLAALASAQRDAARYLYAYAYLSGRTFKDAAANAPHISACNVPPLLAAMSKEPPL